MGGALACMRQRKGTYRSLVVKSERDYIGDPGVDGRIILRWIYRK